MGLAVQLMKKTVVECFFLSVVSISSIQADVIGYLLSLASGQADVMFRTRSVEKVLADPEFPDSLKTKIRMVEDIRQFAFNTLGLNKCKNYTRVYDQKGKPLLWVVTASEKYALKPYIWKFPVVGRVSYKGFFSRQQAEKELNSLESQGYDVKMREVNAWSTLGWFNDPILTGFLNQPEGDLANLIIHELSHSTVFISGDVEESENLASFIGDYGARLYLIQKYGENSKQLEEYTQGLDDYRKLSLHLLRGARRLDSLYTSPAFISESVDEKELAKKSMIQLIVNQLDTITFSSPEVYSALSIRKKIPGNALFIEFRQYNNKQSVYEAEFKSVYRSDLKKYIQTLVKRFS